MSTNALSRGPWGRGAIWGPRVEPIVTLNGQNGRNFGGPWGRGRGAVVVGLTWGPRMGPIVTLNGQNKRNFGGRGFPGSASAFFFPRFFSREHKCVIQIWPPRFFSAFFFS